MASRSRGGVSMTDMSRRPDKPIWRVLGMGVAGLWIGLSTGLIVCGVALTWVWSRRIAHYQLTGSLR